MAETLAVRVLGSSIINIRVNEQGHSARGTFKCHCGGIAKFSCCIDTGGIWADCPKCKFYDLN